MRGRAGSWSFISAYVTNINGFVWPGVGQSIEAKPSKNSFRSASILSGFSERFLYHQYPLPLFKIMKKKQSNHENDKLFFRSVSTNY